MILINYIIIKVRIERQINSASVAGWTPVQSAGGQWLRKPGWIDEESASFTDEGLSKTWKKMICRDRDCGISLNRIAVLETDGEMRIWGWGGVLCSLQGGRRQKETSGCNRRGGLTSGGTQLECTNY